LLPDFCPFKGIRRVLANGPARLAVVRAGADNDDRGIIGLLIGKTIL
jgi:hypothetical protein